MKTIAIYVEGGGDSIDGRTALRRGFDALLRVQKEEARTRKLKWKLVMCGGRDAAFKAFNHARGIQGTIAALLVDSEDPFSCVNPEARPAARMAHLTKRDGWAFGDTVPDSVHLMVQCTEAWIAADPAALADFYGQGFLRSALPTHKNLEEVSKVDIYAALARASRTTKTKGEYGKIKHASELLQRINSAEVCQRCQSFADFTDWLSGAIAGA